MGIAGVMIQQAKKRGGLVVTPPVTPTAWLNSAIVDNDGNYNGFIMTGDTTDLTTFGIYKKSTYHAAGGPLMLAKTTSGGNTWYNIAITVDGTQITSTNHSFLRMASGRMLISYTVNGTIYFAYCDTGDNNFLSTGTPIAPATNDVIAQSPSKMVYTSFGTVLFVYYVVGSNGNPAKAILMESTDNGRNFTQKSIIFSHTSATITNATLGDWRANETAICETHPTGNASTSKWIAIARTEVANDGGTAYQVFKSSDGGTTWSIDLTTVAGSYVNDNGQTISGNFSKHLLYSFLASNSPVDIRLYNGTVYVINSERNTTYGMALKYITATPDGAFDNTYTNWTRPVLVKMYVPQGATVDQGYAVFFTNPQGLFASGYHYSSEAPLSGVTKRCYVEFDKIIT